jgi:Spy/CpxP family protein refolding chaperone
MNSQRKFLFMLALWLAVPLFAAGVLAAYQGGGYGGGQGRGGPRGPMSPDDQLKRLTKQLDLTADQQSKIKPILVDSQKKMEDARDSSNGDRQAMREKLMQIRQDTNDQIKAQLNDSQKDKFDKLQQEREDRGGNRRGGPGGPGGAGGGDNSGSGSGGSGGNTPPPQN